eukprot:TRINITY_DN69408_c0_g1_i1.p1 TRINITY_DN69408_c0_g1~~TRINITY_DN69408_c0_g1_i1.p1  ORF type:complete len:365 (+),score=56.54 TRINITY_DN69408_c0_g1_i1:49-1143(+)
MVGVAVVASEAAARLVLRRFGRGRGSGVPSFPGLASLGRCCFQVEGNDGGGIIATSGAHFTSATVITSVRSRASAAGSGFRHFSALLRRPSPPAEWLRLTSATPLAATSTANFSTASQIDYRGPLPADIWHNDASATAAQISMARRSGTVRRAAFVLPRQGRASWRCLNVLGQRIYFRKWQYLRGKVEPRLCGAARDVEPTAIPAAVRAAGVLPARPPTAAELRTLLRTANRTDKATTATVARDPGFSADELRELCGSGFGVHSRGGIGSGYSDYGGGGRGGGGGPCGGGAIASLTGGGGGGDRFRCSGGEGGDERRADRVSPAAKVATTRIAAENSVQVCHAINAADGDLERSFIGRGRRRRR